MAESIDAEVRHLLAQYVAGGISLKELQRSFAKAAWHMGQRASTSDPLAHRVELLLAEFRKGHRSEDELRNEFAATSSRPQVRKVRVWSSDAGFDLWVSASTEGDERSRTDEPIVEVA
jgi:hypothetical protein